MRPNIVWLVFDALRCDRVVGSDALPELTNFGRLTENSVVFHRAYSPGVATPQVFGTLFTGLAPYEHGVTLLPHGRASLSTTLVEELQAAGYLTMCFSENPFISRRTLLGRGFSYHFFKDYEANEMSATTTSGSTITHPLSERISEFWRMLSGRGSSGSEPSTCETESLIRELDVFLGLLPDLASRPVFLYINLMPSHYPYRCRRRDLEQVPAVPPEAFDLDIRELFPKVALQSVGQKTISHDEKEILRAHYDASVYWCDELLGRCLQVLEDRLTDRPLDCIVFSDHGELLGEHGLYWHGRHFYEPLTHVPLWMKLSDGHRYIRHDLAGLEWLFDWTRARADLPLSESQAHRAKRLDGATEAVTLCRRGVPADAIHWFNVVAQNVARKTDKVSPIERTAHEYAVWHASQKLLINYQGEAELYNLDRDPNEESNVAAEQPDIVAQLIDEVDTDCLFSGQLFQDSSSTHEDVMGVDEEVEKRLRALGYLG